MLTVLALSLLVATPEPAVVDEAEPVTGAALLTRALAPEAARPDPLFARTGTGPGCVTCCGAFDQVCLGGLVTRSVDGCISWGTLGGLCGCVGGMLCGLVPGIMVANGIEVVTGGAEGAPDGSGAILGFLLAGGTVGALTGAGLGGAAGLVLGPMSGGGGAPVDDGSGGYDDDGGYDDGDDRAPSYRERDGTAPKDGSSSKKKDRKKKDRKKKDRTSPEGSRTTRDRSGGSDDRSGGAVDDRSGGAVDDRSGTSDDRSGGTAPTERKAREKKDEKKDEKKKSEKKKKDADDDDDETNDLKKKKKPMGARAFAPAPLALAF